MLGLLFLFESNHSGIETGLALGQPQGTLHTGLNRTIVELRLLFGIRYYFTISLFESNHSGIETAGGKFFMELFNNSLNRTIVELRQGKDIFNYNLFHFV